MIDVVFLMIFATFCTVSDYNECGYIIILSAEDLDIVRQDYADRYGWKPTEEGYNLRGFYFQLYPYNLIYVGTEYQFTESEHGCITVWHELSHADMKGIDEVFEHAEMDRKYKCGKSSLQFIG